MTETARAKSVKKPTDRKAPGGKWTATYKGKKFTIDPEVFEDYEFLELSGEVDENASKVTKLLKLVFGEEQHDALKEAVRGENGRVKSEAMMEAYAAIVEEAGAKNS